MSIKYLQRNMPANRKRFQLCQRDVKQQSKESVEKVKTATLAETAAKNGRTRWDCIRKLQMVHSGRRSIRNSTVYDKNGLLITNPKEL